jgi:trehalose 6-phosphate phosphatase
VYASDSTADNAPPDPVGALVPRLLDLLGSGRTGLVTDVDGTISPIVPEPRDAALTPGARAALAALRERLTVVAVVSGRRAADAREMVGLDGLVYIGNHGLEQWTSTEGASIAPEARPWAGRLTTVLDDLARQLPQPGIVVENKGATGSLHYRMAPHPDQARRALLELVARRAITSGLRVEEGRMVINLLPPLTVTKGSAVSWLVREQQLDRVVYLGDDVTDAHAFRALGILRQRGAIRTLGIGVVGAETPLSVRQLADASVPSVAAVAELLCRVARGLPARNGPAAGATMD